MKRSLFPQADDVICPTSKFFSLSQGGFDPFVLKQRDQHIPKHQLPVPSMAA
jgi:hypothetical protein